MKARRTPTSNHVYRLAGGTEDNDLHCRVGQGYPDLAPDDPCARSPYVAAVYEPSPAERAAVATGANLELVILGGGWPPTMLNVTREQAKSNPQRLLDTDEATLCLEVDRATIVALIAAITAVGGDVGDGPTGAVPLLPPEPIARLELLRTELERGLAAIDAQELDDA